MTRQYFPPLGITCGYRPRLSKSLRGLWEGWHRVLAHPSAYEGISCPVGGDTSRCTFARVRLRESVRDGLRNQNAENRGIFSATETARDAVRKVIGGERGIRTLEGLLTLTPLAGVRLRPLGHLSGGRNHNEPETGWQRNAQKRFKRAKSPAERPSARRNSNDRPCPGRS